MADTGFNTAATVESNAWSGLAVTAAKLATADDDRATTNNTSFEAAQISDFSFGIPAGATILGIEVTAQFRNSAVPTSTLQLSLSHNDGTNYTATKSDTVAGTTDTDKTFGGPTDTWGRSWTDSEFADGAFRLKLEGKTSNGIGFMQLDYLAVKVYYSTDKSGVLNLTMGAFTLSAAGRLEIQGALNVSMGAFTLVGEGTSAIFAAFAKTFNPFTVLGVGRLEIQGALNVSMGAFILDGTTTHFYQSVLSALLGAITMAGSGLVYFAEDASIPQRFSLHTRIYGFVCKRPKTIYMVPERATRKEVTP